MIAATLLLLTVTAAQPVFPDQYRAKLTVSLPYADFVQPINVWYDAPSKQVRFDYYDGINRFFYNLEKNVGYAIVPMITSETCFVVHEQDIEFNSVLPDLDGFKETGVHKLVNGHLCNEWYFETMHGETEHKYYYYEDVKTKAPIRFHIYGYNTPLHSHSDEYIYDYEEVVFEAPDPEVFREPEVKWTCIPFPGPGAFDFDVRSKSIIGDSLRFISRRFPTRSREVFDAFLKEHGLTYSSEIEKETRYLNFLRNKAHIELVNSENRSYKLALNRFADRSPDEIQALLGLQRSHSKDYEKHKFPKSGTYQSSRDKRVDWREKGVVSDVKDQCMCGSCWTYGTTGVLEGQYALKTGKLVLLSEQNLLDCSWNFGNCGCNGGEDFRAYGWMMHNGGIMTHEDYGKYLGIDGYCHHDPSKSVLRVEDYVLITPFDVEELEEAVETVGPISVGVAVTMDFLFYHSGVLNDPECSPAPEEQAHAVLAVGMGTDEESGLTYWLIKNSWSTYWGDEGYIKIARKNNVCGVATSASYPIIEVV